MLFEILLVKRQSRGISVYVVSEKVSRLEGATYPPTWMDWPMLYAGEPQVLAPNMVFFLHMILLNSDTGLGMSLGETAIVTETGCEPISRAPRQLLIGAG